MKPFTKDNLLNWVQSVSAGFEPGGRIRHRTALENGIGVNDLMESLYDTVEYNFPQLIPLLAIVEPNDLENRARIELSDSLTIAFKPDWESKGHQRTTDSTGKVKFGELFVYPPRTAMIFNLYPAEFQDNPEPFLMLTLWDNGSRVKDVVSPLHENSYRRSILDILGRYMQMPANQVQQYHNEARSYIKKELGLGRDRAIQKIVEDSIEDILEVEATVFFHMLDKLRYEKIRKQIAASNLTLREKQRRRKAILDEEMYADMELFGFDTVDAYFAFEDQLEQLSGDARTEFIANQLRSTRESNINQAIQNIRNLILTNFTLHEMFHFPFLTEEEILDEVHQRLKAQDTEGKTDLQIYKNIQKRLEDQIARNRNNPKKRSKQTIALMTALGAGWLLGRDRIR